MERESTNLTVPQRVLLKCLGSGTDWRKSKVKPATVQLAILKGWIERDDANQLVLTDQGRAALAALLEDR